MANQRYVFKITSNNRVTLPIEFRKHMGLKTGDGVTFFEEKSEVVIKKINPRNAVSP